LLLFVVVIEDYTTNHRPRVAQFMYNSADISAHVAVC